MIGPAALGLLWACSSSPPQPEPTIDRATAEAEAEALAQQQVPDASAAGPDQDAAHPDAAHPDAAHPDAAHPDAQPVAEPVEIVLVWHGIGALYRTYFADADAVVALERDLAGQVEGPANIYVRYDSDEFIGQIRLQLRPGTLRAHVDAADDRVDLADLAGITRALATYRSTIASHYDVRVQSFHVGIESFRGAHSCIFTVAGSPPPDGRVVSPCVLVDSQERCGEPDPTGVRFTPAVARIIRSCLDL